VTTKAIVIFLGDFQEHERCSRCNIC